MDLMLLLSIKVFGFSLCVCLSVYLSVCLSLSSPVSVSERQTIRQTPTESVTFGMHFVSLTGSRELSPHMRA